MPDLEQNMDDLFRKAAENYPLKTGDSNWDKIVPALLNNPLTPGATTAKKTTKKRAGLLLLLLSLLVAGVIMTTDLGNKKEIATVQQASKSKTITTAINKETADVYDKQNAEKNLSTGKKALPKKPISINSHIVPLTKNEFEIAWLGAVENKTTKIRQLPVKAEIVQSTSDGIMDKAKKDAAHGNTATKQQAPRPDLDNLFIMNKVVPTKDSINQKENTVAIENPVKKPITRSSNQRSIYLGAVGGPSFNEVKHQGLKKPGFSAGIIGGYQLNSKIAVETGLLYAKKTYFTDGKYFKTGKISPPMPAGMEIVSLEGSTGVLEIPVKFKYNFWQKKNNHIFSSAGITSYIITHEKNNYLLLINGAQQNMVSSYKNKSRSFAAAFDISMGYEHKIGKFNYMRIEPYVQIPLKGMGVGSIPVMSSGLRIGLAKFIL